MKQKINYLVFETTGKCNLNCRYCYNAWKSPGSDLDGSFDSYKEAKKTLKKAFKLFDIQHVTFTGGEPLLAERFNELVLFTRLAGKSVTIISNGNYATAAEYEELVKLGVSLFELPIHSYRADEHDYMTAQKGSWEKSLASIEVIRNAGGAVVPVLILTKANIAIMEETLAFIKSLGLNRIMLNRFNIGGNGIAEMENLLPTLDEIRDAFKTASKVSTQLGLKITSNVCSPVCVLDPQDYQNIGFSLCSPHNIESRPYTLDIKGDIRFCNHSPITMGNIYKNSNKEIFQTDYLKEWQTDTPDYCNECDKYNRCFGGCRAASEQMGTGLGGVDPLVHKLIE